MFCRAMSYRNFNTLRYFEGCASSALQQKLVAFQSKQRWGFPVLAVLAILLSPVHLMVRLLFNITLICRLVVSSW